MWKLFKKKNKELEALYQKIVLEAENNYKDAAREAFAEYERRLMELEKEGALTGALLTHYRELAEQKRRELEGFRH